jgi:DNA-binding CsgD family transcriptional regulator
MQNVSASRVRKVLEAATLAIEFRGIAEFRAGTLTLVRDLVPCESASYNEVRPGVRPIVVADPHADLSPAELEQFGSVAGENPLIAHYTRTGDGQPLRFSDLISRRRLHRLTIYDQIYRHMGVEHQLAFVLPAPPGQVVGIALNRERSDFTDEEAAMLELLRTPLQACYQRLLEHESLIDLLHAREGRDQIAERACELGLSERELQVMRSVIRGASNAEVGLSLGISRRTVEKHLQNIYMRLDVTSRTQAVGKLASGAPPSLDV